MLINQAKKGWLMPALLLFLQSRYLGPTRCQRCYQVIDYICITEGLSDEVGIALLLKIGSQGNVRTTMLKAFAKQSFAAIVKKMP